MVTVIAIYGGGTIGRLKGEHNWTGLKVKVTHGKKRIKEEKHESNNDAMGRSSAN